MPRGPAKTKSFWEKYPKRLAGWWVGGGGGGVIMDYFGNDLVPGIAERNILIKMGLQIATLRARMHSSYYTG